MSREIKRRDDAATSRDGNVRAALSGVRLFMVESGAHSALGWISSKRGDVKGHLEAVAACLGVHDWEPHFDFHWRALRGLSHALEGETELAILDLRRALSGCGPDDDEYLKCCGALAALLYERKRPGDMAMGLRYLAHARAVLADERSVGATDAPSELQRAITVFNRHSVRLAPDIPEAARGNNTPREPVLGKPPPFQVPEETRIRGSRIPTVLQTPRDDQKHPTRKSPRPSPRSSREPSPRDDAESTTKPPPRPDAEPPRA